MLIDKNSKVHGEPVQINRLKIAYFRAPAPSPYLTSEVKTRINLHILRAD